MQLAGLVEAAMSQAEGMHTKPGHFSAVSSVFHRKRCKIAPRCPGSRRNGCAESTVEPVNDRSCFAARRSDVPCRAASCSSAEELESHRVPPASCRSPASFSKRLLSSAGAWRPLTLGFPSVSGGVAAFPICALVGALSPSLPARAGLRADGVESGWVHVGIQSYLFCSDSCL